MNAALQVKTAFDRPNRAPALGVLLTLATLFFLAAVDSLAQTIETSRKNEPAIRKLFISSASASLAGGKARLVLTSLTRKGASYVGDYHLKVVPYFFKSEKGTLSMTVSEQSLLNLNQNVPVEFGGKATTNGTARTRPITARAAQTAPLRGTVKISIVTENGPLVFNTFYRFGDQ
jgi:hypothetical protein